MRKSSFLDCYNKKWSRHQNTKLFTDPKKEFNTKLDNSAFKITFSFGLFFTLGSLFFLYPYLTLSKKSFDSSLIYGLVSLLVGLFSLVGSMKRKSSVDYYYKQRQKSPTNPQAWQKDWQQGFTKSHVKDEATSLLVLFLFTGLALFVIYFLKDFTFVKLQNIWNDPSAGPTVIFGTIFGGLFLIGAIYFSFHEVIQGTLQRLKYGRAVLKFNGSLKAGSNADMSIHLSSKLNIQKAKVIFLCQKVTTGRSASLDNMIDKEEILWTEDQDLSVNDNTVIFSFTIPIDLPRTKFEYPKIEWIVKLEESADSPYEVSFIIPVADK